MEQIFILSSIADRRYLIESQSIPIMRFVKYRKGKFDVMRLTEKRGNYFIVHTPGLDKSNNSYSFESAETPGKFLTTTKRMQIAFKKESEVKSSKQNKAAATFKSVGDIFNVRIFRNGLLIYNRSRSRTLVIVISDQILRHSFAEIPFTIDSLYRNEYNK